MAEILLSLTIIGVVAAITLPSLTGNINERTWNTQRKALYARMSQAISLMPALNGYGTLSDTEDNATETFITAGLAKVLKINNICDSEHLKECGITSKVRDINGDLAFEAFPSTLVGYNVMFNSTYVYSDTGEAHGWTQKDTKAAAFETANGESIVTYYNPLCDAGKYEADGTMYMTQPKICVNMIFDLNGSKGPNTFGKDIGFMSAIYSSDSVVVMPTVSKVLNDSTTQLAAGRLCKGNDDETRLPNNEELFSIFANRKLLGLDSTQRHYWSSTVSGPNTAWLMGIHHGGIVSRYERDNGNYFAVCVKR